MSMSMIKTKMVLFAAAVMALAAGPASAITLSMNPVSQTVAPGDPASLDIVISGLGFGAAPSLGTFDVEVSYDDSLLALSAVGIGDPGLGDQLDLFGLGSISGDSPLAPGLHDIFEISLDLPTDLDALQFDSFTLATLDFATLGTGIASVGFGNVTLGDSFGAPLQASVSGARITIRQPSNGIPEPAPLALLLPGLMWLRLSRRDG